MFFCVFYEAHLNNTFKLNISKFYYFSLVSFANANQLILFLYN